MLPITQFARRLAALCGAWAVAAAVQAHGAVQISRQGDERAVKTPRYSATVAADGCLTSFKIGNDEYLAPGVDISRGVYLFDNGPIALKTITEPAAGSVLASSERASVRYDFTDDAVKITATNASAKATPLYVVLTPRLAAAADDAGSFVQAPTTQSWGSAAFFGGSTKLRVSGAERLWPWTGNTQVVELNLGPNDARTLTLAADTRTDGDRAKLASTVFDLANLPAIQLQSPLNYQVFQRQSRFQGAIRVAGHLATPGAAVEARVTGAGLKGALPGKWQAVTVDPATHGFLAVISTPAGGWYRVEVRARKGRETIATETVEKVGVGEVFLGAGQSNSTNYGETRTKQTSGMVATFSGKDWRLADDPQPGTHDNSTGGSFWPSFGDDMYAHCRVPIGIATTGHGGTSVNQWQPGGELFNWTMTRVLQLGPSGFRALLWHQGESDTGMEADEYAAKLGTVIVASRKAAGWDFPWFVAQVSYHDPAHTWFPSPRVAQEKLWNAGLALRGPNTDDLTGDNRDHNGAGIHFSPKGLKAHGDLWAGLVSAYIDRLFGTK